MAQVGKRYATTKSVITVIVILTVALVLIYLGYWKFIIAYFCVSYALSCLWFAGVKKMPIRKALLQSVWIALSWFGLYDDKSTAKKVGKKK